MNADVIFQVRRMHVNIINVNIKKLSIFRPLYLYDFTGYCDKSNYNKYLTLDFLANFVKNIIYKIIYNKDPN